MAGALLAALVGQPASAGTQAGPCEQIVEACRAAGFVAGEAKEGFGLWRDCVRPIVRGAAPPAKTDKPLPPVPADTISACKAKRPNFGEGRGGDRAPQPQPQPQG
jgi:hypothetical protein